ncbi:sigma-54 interaction domain-containing protein [Aliikangiella maris]|uniref:Sigma-54 dependent transcriptional regulator n=2 Tax=Aliikangiella maris TaxID=3162458 RepID=A0ABV2BVA8_9GAMM
MYTPKLFVHAENTSLLALVESSKTTQRFQCVFSEQKEKRWIQQIDEDETIDLALIYLSALSEEDQYDLLNSQCFNRVDFIFISDGTPNPNIDALMAASAGFHFREPYNVGLLEDTISDFYEGYAARNAKAKSIKSSQLDQFGLLLGSSEVMHKLYRVLRKVAEAESNVFIIGESGAGKELVANTVHNASPRSANAFVAVNCGALSPELVESELFGHLKGAFTGATKDRQGLFAQAEGGSLFLDEITEMPLDHQVKLLRVLESREYRPVGSTTTQYTNVRVIAATNRDPVQAIKDGLLREDLYYRLAQFPIQLPPLREREDDILGLALHFLAHRNAEEKYQKEIDAQALEKIKSHNWPGNVRELKYTMERAFILSEKVIHAEHILLDILSPSTANDSMSIQPGIPLSEIEQTAIETTLKANQGNRGETAEQLGISVKTLYNKLEKYQQEDN